MGRLDEYICLTIMNISYRFLHEESLVPFFKLGAGGKVVEGKARMTTAICFSSQSSIAPPFLELLEVKIQDLKPESVGIGDLIDKKNS